MFAFETESAVMANAFVTASVAGMCVMEGT